MKIGRKLKKDNLFAEPPPFEIHSIQSLITENREGSTSLFCEKMYLIVWMLKGVAKISLDTDVFLINENVFFYVRSGQVFTMEIDDEATGYVIAFVEAYVDLTDVRLAGLFHASFFNRFNTIPMVYIWGDAIPVMVSFADKMIQEYNNALDLRSDILKGYLKIFMIYLCRQLRLDSQGIYWSRKADLVKLFFTQLEMHYASKKMVKEYAELLSVSPNYLNGVVKELSGRPVSHHIQQRIVLEAKRRVIHDGYSLKETAYDLGFWDPAHFSKYFKNCSGINFTDFKRGIAI